MLHPRRLRAIALALPGLLLVVAPSGAAATTETHTQTARSGAVTASFTFHGPYASFPFYRGETLTIRRAGKIVYARAVNAGRPCGSSCQPGDTRKRGHSVHILDLERNGRPDIVLDLYSGGAHCCSIEQIFRYAPARRSYVKTQHNFGDPGERIVDLGHNGRLEFLTADDRFAYAFTDFAASGLPVSVLTFSGGHFHNVTRGYPALVAQDAAMWLHEFNTVGLKYKDTLGLIAAWAADEDLLGNSQQVSSFLAQQAAAGHLVSPGQAGGQSFINTLNTFLRHTGYLP